MRSSPARPEHQTTLLPSYRLTALQALNARQMGLRFQLWKNPLSRSIGPSHCRRDDEIDTDNARNYQPNFGCPG